MGYSVRGSGAGSQRERMGVGGLLPSLTLVVSPRLIRSPALVPEKEDERECKCYDAPNDVPKVPLFDDSERFRHAMEESVVSTPGP